jgi:bacteriocin-like protein
MVKKKKPKKKFKKLNKKELKKIKGGVDIMEKIMEHGFGEEQGTGTHFVVDVSGISRFMAGFKIKF